MNHINRLRQLFMAFCLILVLGVAMFAAGSVQTAQAAVPSGFSEYYVPGGTNQLFQLLQANDNSPMLGNAFGYAGDTCGTGGQDSANGHGGLAGGCNYMHNVTTVSVASDNVTVYYDQWENGYGTGAAGDETYHVSKGNILTFESDHIRVPRTNAAQCNSTSKKNGVATGVTPANCYDGRDRIYVLGGAVSVAQAFWPEATGTVYANAWEIYPIKPEQTQYFIPVGIDLYASSNTTYHDFQHVYVIVEATADNTTVNIHDPNSNPADVNATLNRGEVTQMFGIDAGTRVTTSKPAQVQFVVGYYTANLYSESRSYTAVPSSLWSTAYISPVPSGGTNTNGGTSNTDIYIYNPNSYALSVNYQDRTGSGTISVPANSTRSYQNLVGRYVPTTSGVYLEAADSNSHFWAIGSYDARSADYQWGFSLIPTNLLSSEYYVSWAPGNNTVGTGSLSGVNGSPVYVGAVNNNTTVYVDYPPADGVANVSYVLNRTGYQKLNNPGATLDNTGMHVWANGPITLVWGQDATVSPLSNPGIDAGYTILPLNKAWIDVVVLLDKSATPSTITNAAGQTVWFDLVIDSDVNPLDRVDVSDTLPANFGYVSGSTTITLADGSTLTGAAANPTIAGQKLTWDNVGNSVGKSGMPINKRETIRFQAITTAIPFASPVGGDAFNNASVDAEVGINTFTTSDDALVTVRPSVDLIAVKSNDVGSAVLAGGSFNWNIQVTNRGTVNTVTFNQSLTILRDNLPANVTSYGAPVVTASGASGNMTCSIATNILTCSTGAGQTYQLPPGAYFNVRIPVNTTATAAILSNPAGGGVCQVDPNGNITEDYENNNLCADSVTTHQLDLAAFKTNDAGGGVFAGNPFNWIITVSSNLNVNFTSGWRILVDNLPNGAPTNPVYGIPTVANGSGTTGTITCTIASNTLTCTAGSAVTLAAGDSFSVSIPVTPANAGALTNPASSLLCQVDPDSHTVENNRTNNNCTNTVTVAANVPSISKAFLPGTIQANGTSVLRLTITNPSDVNSQTNVSFADTLPNSPAQMRVATPAVYSTSGCGSPTFTPTANATNLSFSGGTIAAGGTCIVSVNITAPSAGNYSNISGAVSSANGTGNTASATLTVTAAPAGTLDANVYVDANGNGVKDGGETTNLSGVTLRLCSDDTCATILQTQVTDVNGNYSFTNLSAGTYYVQETDPSGYVSTTSNMIAVNVPSGGTGTGSFGDSRPSTVGNFVWVDSNANGLQDGGEPGLNGVTVSLYNAGANGAIGGGDDTLFGTLTTAGGGAYQFTNIPAGIYYVQTTLPSGYVYTTQYNGTGNPANPNAATDSNITPATSNSGLVTLAGPAAGGTTDLTIDAGLYQLASLTGNVWVDANGNGSKDGGEATNLSGVTVSLTGPNCAPCTTTTDVNGNYSFTNLQPGSYTVVETDPSGYISTTPNSLARTLTSGDTGTANFGDVLPATIGDFVWYDLDGDNVQDGGSETGIPNVRVYLDANSNSAYDAGEPTAVTDAAGAYSIGGLVAGTYLVQIDSVTVPSNYGLTGATLPLSVTLTAGQVFTTADFGYQPRGSVVGHLFIDINGNGSQDTGEPNLPNVDVIITDAYGGVRTVASDANGSYTAANVPAGAVLVNVDETDPQFPTGYAQTAGADPTNVTVTAGATADAGNDGYYPAASVSGHLYVDTNGNGAQDTGEPNLPNVNVIVLDASGVSQIAASDANGNWTASVLPGSISADVDETDPQFPTGYAQTEGADPTTVTAAANANTSAGNDGYSPAATVSGHLYIDTDGNGAQDTGEPNLANVNVIITDTSGVSQTIASNANGDWMALVLPGSVSADVDETDPQYPVGYTQTEGTEPTTVMATANTNTFAGNDGYNPAATVSGHLYIDTDANGSQDTGEPNLADVNVIITDTSGVSQTVTTDANGNWTALVLPGSLTADVDETDPQYPAGYIQTEGNDPTVVTATANANTFAGNDGYHQPQGSIGNLVWGDDGDGVQETGEPGVSGVTVNLYHAGLDGAIGGGDDVLAATTVTANDGSYQFANLLPGGYYVNFVLPGGYTFALADAGGDDTLDSDADGAGQTPVFTIIMDQVNQTLDAGLISNLDYGDLPSGYEDTIHGDDGARHILGTLLLGPAADTDPEGQEDDTAAGDSNDDGVTRDMNDNWLNGATVDIVIDLQGATASSLADVGMWVDWNGDGVFGPADFFSFSGLTVGVTNTVQIIVPANTEYTVGHTLNVRVRAFDPANLPGGALDVSDYLGLATNGEVEDYQWPFAAPTAITLAVFNAHSTSPVNWLALGGLGMSVSVYLVGRLFRRRFAYRRTK